MCGHAERMPSRHLCLCHLLVDAVDACCELFDLCDFIRDSMVVLDALKQRVLMLLLRIDGEREIEWDATCHTTSHGMEGADQMCVQLREQGAEVRRMMEQEGSEGREVPHIHSMRVSTSTRQHRDGGQDASQL